MRDGGNTHEASWQAAYISLKNERGGLFKISPRQAATIIVQQVVGNTERYDNCIQFLGDLYPKPKPEDMIENNINPDRPQENEKEKYIEDSWLLYTSPSPRAQRGSGVPT